MTISDLSDARLAAALADQAGQLLVQIRSGQFADAKERGIAGDRQSNSFLMAELAATRPGDAVLSEEEADDPVRLDANRVWIIDPLDGTREYSMGDRDDWAVHVGLWESGRGMTSCAVSLPALGLVFATDDPSPPHSVGSPRSRPLILVSDSRPPAFAAPVAEQVGGDVAPMGSAGAKAMAVLRGEADAYLHAGGQWEWDSAAPVGVLQAAGFHASRIDGSPLLYNQPHPYLPDLLICRPDLARPLLSAIAEFADS